MARAKPIKGLDSQAPTGENARIIARIRLEELYSWSQYVDNPYNVRELHNLRIAAKRLRYTLEVFEDALPYACHAIVKELTSIQDELGALHDSDVMIALLRLCLGSQDSGTAYEQALVDTQKSQNKKGFILPAELVADLLDPEVAPSAEQRFGLEQMLLKQHQLREEHYNAFRQRWYQLQARDFRREILSALDAF
ncbi:MAG TPA: CHAD domain-containing protein [Ktedonobacteraceae bacterium]